MRIIREEATFSNSTKEERLEFRELKRKQGFFEFISEPEYWWSIFEKDRISFGDYCILIIKLNLFNLFGNLLEGR